MHLHWIMYIYTNSGLSNPLDYTNLKHTKLDQSKNQNALNYASTLHKDDINGEEFEPYDEPYQEEENDFVLQLKGKEIPSLEETEKFLIQKHWKFLAAIDVKPLKHSE